MSAHPRVAVIGAGASGLASAKALLTRGADVVVYDKGDRPGGLWLQGNSSGLSPAYDSLHLNTSKGRTEFAAYPMPTNWPDYPSAARVAGYLRDFADAFGVTEHIRFSTSVTDVDRAGDGHGDGWIVTADRNGSERYDAVIVANGHNWTPRYPEPAYPGTFAGQQLHAHDYRSPEAFRGKRVLVVGMGNSAMDIAVDAVETAADVQLSARHGVHIIPKYLYGRPADATGGALAFLPWRIRQTLAQTLLSLSVGRLERYGLPKPSRGLFQSHPTISDGIFHRLTHGEITPRPGISHFDGAAVVFRDGERAEVDVIVWATGYRVAIPFLSERWLGRDPEALALYRHVFHPEDPSLAFVGLMQSTGAALPVVEAQANLAASYLTGTYALPTREEQARAVAHDYRAAVQRWGATSRPMMRIDFDGYLAEVARELAIGARRRQRGGAVFAPAMRKHDTHALSAEANR
ncbi:MAG: FAD-dependent oxidoreductase [Microbacteriaceae bacterium]